MTLKNTGRINPVLLVIGLVVAVVVIWVATGSQRHGPLESVELKDVPDTRVNGDTTKQANTLSKSNEQPFPPFDSSAGLKAKANKTGDGKQVGSKSRSSSLHRTPEEHRAAIDAAAPRREQLRKNMKKHLGDQYTDAQIDSMIKH